jgi:hypothetical protein
MSRTPTRIANHPAEAARASWNPYLDRWAAAGRDAALAGDLRAALIREYAFAIPGEEALSCIARHAPVVEVGAGSGYWARCLRERGVDVVAYDELGDQWHAWFRELWTDVVRGGPEALAGHADRTLLLCWPDPWTGMDEAALRAHAGRRLAHVGEAGARGPGTEGFRRLLSSEWRPIERTRVPRWPGCHDRLVVYERR